MNWLGATWTLWRETTTW